MGEGLLDKAIAEIAIMNLATAVEPTRCGSDPDVESVNSTQGD
jgi:hypothetical protein